MMTTMKRTIDGELGALYFKFPNKQVTVKKVLLALLDHLGLKTRLTFVGDECKIHFEKEG